MEAKLIALGVETFKIALLLAFQATTQINEMTLSFIPKILGVVIVIILTMPWMLNAMTDFSVNVFNLIPTFVE